MIDSFALLLTHGLMLLAAWRLLTRRDLDQEGEVERPSRIKRPGERPRGDA
ncbi:hypothetical protein QE385_003019 [Sphingomonas sp. SORGH_AS 950]|uniref:hypothetical protein n=1 Tax=unclassified Sphingomonas TaxID=196159 RepID=UPI00277F102C|nr:MULTISPECIES: hypothetical protein [unclassified Sphingomonas]MDQ1158692.1 hypothetical protein [Sphingomonas sp. SORGH_AS_0950]MDR6113468.1 hypothetical protein [Sphingomonas sp. SORGH_AS_0789]MDR6145422.1 hypothetical protein [Sphingomonas sp. SORGH_AS_0870]MDR6149171.1 hypothetical protein [Sphingomonas sp. SORGH_AS_0742]